MKKLVSLALVSAIMASAFTLSACNEGNTEQSSSENSSISQPNAESFVQSIVEISIEESKAEITASQISELNQTLTDYTSVPEFTCESDVIDAESISDGVILSLIADNKSDSFSSLVVKQFVSAANRAGFKKAVAPDTDGMAASYNDALTNAVNSNYEAVMMFGNINKDEIGSEIEQVQANGIKVISAGNAGVDQTEHYVDNVVPINYQRAGQLLADWCIVNQKGKVNALAVTCSDSGSSYAAYEGFAKEFQTYVSSGYCTTLNVPSIEVGNGLASKVKSALAADPNINYIVVFDDSLIDDAISGMEQSSSNRVKIVATGGSPEAFDDAEKGKIEMLVAQSYEWTAYAMVDYALRVLAKEELPKEQDVPVRIVTSQSIKEELADYIEANGEDSVDEFYEICFGAAFIEGYYGLWNLE